MALAQRYEQLRAGVLAGDGHGQRFGLGVLTSHGMAGWMTAWQAIPPGPAVTTPAAPPAGGIGEMVRLLAAMAVAHV